MKIDQSDCCDQTWVMSKRARSARQDSAAAVTRSSHAAFPITFELCIDSHVGHPLPAFPRKLPLLMRYYNSLTWLSQREEGLCQLGHLRSQIHHLMPSTHKRTTRWTAAHTFRHTPQMLNIAVPVHASHHFLHLIHQRVGKVLLGRSWSSR